MLHTSYRIMTLIELISSRQEAAALQALAHGANANESDPDGNTALMYSSNYVLLSLAAALISAGSNVNGSNSLGYFHTCD